MKTTFQRRLTMAIGLLVSGTVFVMATLIIWSAVSNIVRHYETMAVSYSNLATRYIRDHSVMYDEEYRRATESLMRSKVDLEQALEGSGTIPPGQTWEAFSLLLGRSLNNLRETILPPFSLQESLDEIYQRLSLSEALALDVRGEVVARSGSAAAAARDGVDPTVLAMVQTLLADPEKQPISRKVGQEVGVATLLHVPGHDPLVLYMRHRLTDSQILIRETVAYVAFFAAVLIVGSLLLSWWVSRSLARPIDALARGVREIGEGNLDFDVKLETRDEIQEMAQAVGNVVGTLRTAMDELEQETVRRELLEHELHIASELQLALLPDAPPVMAGIELLGWSRPAKEVGGDFYDFIELGPRRLAVAIGDATGKGLPAALLLTESWSVLRTLAEDMSGPAELLFRTNNALSRRIRSTGRFVTLFVGIIDLDRQRITYASAGHNPPVLVGARDSRHVRLAADQGLPLGITAGTQYSEHELALESGDTMLLYSDGLTEAQNVRGELYGESRVQAMMDELHGRPVLEVLAAIKQDMDRHIGGAEVHDDITLVGLRYIPEAQNPQG